MKTLFQYKTYFFSVLEKVCIFITYPYTKNRSLLGLFNHCHLWPFHISFTSFQWTLKQLMQFFSKWMYIKIRSQFISQFSFMWRILRAWSRCMSAVVVCHTEIITSLLSFFVEKMIEDFNLSRRGELSTKANADGLQYIGFIWFPLDFGLYRLFSLKWRVVISPLQHISFQSGPL